MKIYTVSSCNADWSNKKIEKFFTNKDQALAYYYFLKLAFEVNGNKQIAVYSINETDDWTQKESYYEAVGWFNENKLYDFALRAVELDEKLHLRNIRKDKDCSYMSIVSIIIKPKECESSSEFIIRAKNELRKAHLKLTGQVNDNETVCCRK